MDKGVRNACVLGLGFMISAQTSTVDIENRTNGCGDHFYALDYDRISQFQSL